MNEIFSQFTSIPLVDATIWLVICLIFMFAVLDGIVWRIFRREQANVVYFMQGKKVVGQFKKINVYRFICQFNSNRLDG